MIAKASIWLAKKRYAQWIINNNGVTCDELEVKGLDVVRSSFPTRFRKFMTEILKDILKDVPKEEIDDKIVTLKKQVKNESVDDIAKTSAVKNISKYVKMMDKGAVMGECAKSTPAHVKSSIIHNQFLKKFKIQSEPIRDGEKIKWIYLKNNELGLDALAFRGYEDPPQLMEFIEKYADKDKLFERELEGKLRDFYDALSWDFASENLANAQKVFCFLMANYNQILPIRKDCRIDEQFGWLPLSVLEPSRDHREQWPEAYLDDGIRETKRSKDAENLPGLRFSEFHAGLAEQILRYWSMRGSVIVDPFSGRATRAMVASKLGRNYQGYEVSKKTYDRCMSHFKKFKVSPKLFNCDGTEMLYTRNETADLVFTCPPYHNLEKYETAKNQLSECETYEDFMVQIQKCGKNINRVLKRSILRMGCFRLERYDR